MLQSAHPLDFNPIFYAPCDSKAGSDSLMSASNSLLTIALPVFNAGQPLRLAVQSIVNQSFEDWELLIIDDGSTDGAVEFLRSSLDPRVRIVRDGQNRGLAARLNEAVQMARGDYFARMDQDDICHPDRFAQQIAFLQANCSVDLLGAQCITIDEQERVNGVLPAAVTHAEICRRPWLGFYLPHPTWVGKTAWFMAHLYPNPAPYCCEDQELLLRASRTSQYHTVPLYLLAYRVRTDTPWKKSWRTRRALAKMQAAYFLSRGSYGKAILSCLAAAFRVGSDALKKIAVFVGMWRSPRARSLSPDEQRFWEALIAALKAKSDG